MIGTVEELPPNPTHGVFPANIVPSPFPMLQTHFPRWSRVGRLGRNRYPKTVKQDHLSSVSHASMARHNAGQSAKKSKSTFENLNATGKSSASSVSSDVSAAEVISVNLSHRVVVLEKNIKFLKEKHLEMLSALHQEVEKLKQENKELQFQLVMSSCLECSTNILNKDNSLQEAKAVVENREEEKVLSETDNLADNQRILFLEEEIQELRQALHDARTRNYYLANLLEQANKKQEPPCRPTSNLSLLDLKPTTGPLMVYPKDEAPRPPLLQECEVIIKHLQEINEQQEIELSKLKTNLMQCNKLHLHHSDSHNHVERKSKYPQTPNIKLPKIQNKHSPKKGTDPKPIPKEKLMLPALKEPVHSARPTERRRSRQPLIPNTHAKTDS